MAEPVGQGDAGRPRIGLKVPAVGRCVRARKDLHNTRFGPGELPLSGQRPFDRGIQRDVNLALGPPGSVHMVA